ncbi:MAG TPA: hypothetical protein VG838_07480 [Opitutaceae bacterium]|nr:hypothetical protein [Opitutaceae bacterium]
MAKKGSLLLFLSFAGMAPPAFAAYGGIPAGNLGGMLLLFLFILACTSICQICWHEQRHASVGKKFGCSFLGIALLVGVLWLIDRLFFR